MSTISPQLYFETSWSILSSIGLFNVLIGIHVIGITSLSPITIVPIVVSGAGAIANGLCYYAFYSNHPKTPTAAAAAVADIFWLIQEAGLPFYSYQILRSILQGKEKRTFVGIYWALVSIIVIIRAFITGITVQDIMNDSLSKVVFVAHLHIGYFVGIALVEGLSSFFLLRKFFTAQATSVEINSKVGLFSYLMRSTEIRLTALMIIGIARSVTYSFQTTAQSATQTTGQIDRFVVTLENLFPIIMFIDILAAKSLVLQRRNHDYMSSRGHNLENFGQGENRRDADLARGHVVTWVDVGERSSSQEHIVSAGQEVEQRNTSDNFSEAKNGGISKTVEFHTSASPV